MKTIRTSALAVLVVLLTPPIASGQAVQSIGFDELNANPPGSPGLSLDPDHYARLGVHFEGGSPTVLRYDDGFASSPLNGIEMCYSAEFCNAPFNIRFDETQELVAVNVGYSGNLAEVETVALSAFDSDGSSIAFDTVDIGPGPVPIEHRLVVESATGEIARVILRWADGKRIMNSLAMDDLTIVPFVPFVDLVATPSPLDFGTWETPGSDSVAVTLTNTGNVAFAFKTILEPEGGPFGLESDCATLAVQANCTFIVSFAPTTEGEFAANVELLRPSGELISSIPLAGALVPPPPPPPPPTTTRPTITAAPVGVGTDTTAAPAAESTTTTVSPTTTQASVTTTHPTTTTAGSGGGAAGPADPPAGDDAPRWALAALAVLGGGLLARAFRLRRRMRGRSLRVLTRSQPLPERLTSSSHAPDITVKFKTQRSTIRFTEEGA